MKTYLCLALAFSSIPAHAATSCLAFMKDSQGGSVANLPRQIITEAEKVIANHDGITVTIIPPNADTPNIAVSIVNDGRKQLMVGETVWMSGEFLSKSNEAYWILVDCEPAKDQPPEKVTRVRSH